MGDVASGARPVSHESVDEHGVFYLLTGPSHAARLVVSLWSLRQYYDGAVTVFTAQSGTHRLGELFAADERLGVDHRVCSLYDSPKSATFLTKLRLLRDSLPYNVSTYLDADTMVSGDISELFALPDDCEIIATQFSNWMSTKGKIRRRIAPWMKLPQSDFPRDEYVKMVRAALESQPAINTGVFTVRRGATVAESWLKLALIGKQTFICDEIALQILLRRYSHRVLDCRFNCSPIFEADRKDARIWHFHGEKHLRENAAAHWLPVFEECMDENVAGIATWSPGGDRRLRRYLKRTGAAV